MKIVENRKSNFLTWFRKLAKGRSFLIVYPPEGFDPAHDEVNHWQWNRQPKKFKYYWQAAIRAEITNFIAGEYIAIVVEAPD